MIDSQQHSSNGAEWLNSEQRSEFTDSAEEAKLRRSVMIKPKERNKKKYETKFLPRI
jgi:hypothetical protein